MAVYTHIDNNDFQALLADYDLGDLKSFEGITQGVSNTNYHVFTDKGRFVLTIFEEHRTERKDLPYFFAYASHLGARGVTCPQAMMDRMGETIKTVAGKPAVLISYLEGNDIPRGQTKTKYCAAMGGFLAKMHNAAADFSLVRENEWGQESFRHRAEGVKYEMRSFDPGLYDLVFRELDYLDGSWPKEHEKRAVHLDLFPDNIFFTGDKISAMIDMYFTANDYTAFDLAITANAWCFTPEYRWRRPAFRRMVSEYNTGRALEDWEKSSFQTLSRGACMRFLLSRLEEWFAHEDSDVDIQPHDPREYMHRLQFHQEKDVMEDARACLKL